MKHEQGCSHAFQFGRATNQFVEVVDSYGTVFGMGYFPDQIFIRSAEVLDVVIVAQRVQEAVYHGRLSTHDEEIFDENGE